MVDSTKHNALGDGFYRGVGFGVDVRWDSMVDSTKHIWPIIVIVGLLVEVPKQRAVSTEHRKDET